MASYDDKILNMSGETVGVVIATYNGERYINAQLTSILEQTILPDSIIISDAGSTDSTLEICEQYIERNRNINIRILTHADQKKALAVVDNFEKGLRSIDTDYVFFSDQDDVWKPQKIEQVLRRMKEEGATFCFTNAAVVDQDLNDVGVSLWDSYGFSPEMNGQDYFHYMPQKNNDLFLRLLLGNVVTGMTMCMHKSLKPLVLPFSKHAYHDAWISILASFTGGVIALDERLVLYRQHESNLEGANRSKGRIGNFFGRKLKAQERLSFLKDVKSRLSHNEYSIPEVLDDCIEFEEKRVKILSEAHFPTKQEAKEYSRFCQEPQSVLVKDYLFVFYAVLKNLGNSSV